MSATNLRRLFAFAGGMCIGFLCEHYIGYGWEESPFFLAASGLWGWVCAME